MYVDPNGEHPLWHQLGQVADKALKIIQRVAAPLSRIGRGKNKENGQKNGPGTGQYDDVPEVPEGAGKQRNKPPAPLKEAQGRPHSIVEKSGSKGQYTTHHGDGTWKQYRGSGKPHGNIPRPNVKETGINQAPNGKRYVGKPRVRPVRPDEIPR